MSNSERKRPTPPGNSSRRRRPNSSLEGAHSRGRCRTMGCRTSTLRVRPRTRPRATLGVAPPTTGFHNRRILPLEALNEVIRDECGTGNGGTIAERGLGRTRLGGLQSPDVGASGAAGTPRAMATEGGVGRPGMETDRREPIVKLLCRRSCPRVAERRGPCRPENGRSQPAPLRNLDFLDDSSATNAPSHWTHTQPQSPVTLLLAGENTDCETPRRGDSPREQQPGPLHSFRRLWNVP